MIKKYILPILFIILGVFTLAGFSSEAASSTVYVDPSGSCGGKTPCYVWMSDALSNVSDGGTVIVTSNSADNIISPATAQNITIKGENPGITLTGGVNVTAGTVVGWTIQDLNFTGGFLIEDISSSLTVQNISTTGMTLGFFTQDTTADISILNNQFPNDEGSVISILGDAGYDINGSITIQDNTGVDAINIFSNVTSGNPANLNADITLNGNQTIRGANIGVDSALLGGSGFGDVTGAIEIIDNTADDGSGSLGDGKFGITIANDAHGDITGPVNFSSNESVWLAVLTIDSSIGGNISGAITASGNEFEFIELNARGTFSGTVFIDGNNVIDMPGGVAQGPTIQVDGDPLTSDVTIQGNTGGVAQIGVRSELASMTGLIQILNNTVGYIILDAQGGAITQSYTMSGNILPTGDPPYSAITIKTVAGDLTGGVMNGNAFDVLQFDIDGVLTGPLTFSNNTSRELASFFSQSSSSGPGVITIKGNDFRDETYFKSFTSNLEFNRHMGLMSVVSGTSVEALNNWWGCNQGPGSSGCAPTPNSPSPISTEPWLLFNAGVTCNSTTSATVAFDVHQNSLGSFPSGNITPGQVVVSSTIGTVVGSPADLLNGAGTVTVTFPEGSEPEITAQLYSEVVIMNPVCDLAKDTIGNFRSTNGVIYLKNTHGAGYADIEFSYGMPGDQFFSGDWDNDGVDTIGNFRNGVIFMRNSNTTGYADFQFGYGIPGDDVVVGDWDNDGIDTIGTFRDGVFYLRNSNSTGYADITFGFGLPGDIPIAGDWDGDGFDTVGVFREGVFYLINSHTTGYADIEFGFGISGDIPITGDWNGDGIDSVGTFRGGIVYLKNANTTGYADITFGYGMPGDDPLAGNWDGLP
jgi:hypothetical protein